MVARSDAGVPASFVATAVDARQYRGRLLASEKRIVRVSERLWAVPSEVDGARYAIDIEVGTCSCPDFETTGEKCKHLWAVEYARNQVSEQDGIPVLPPQRITYGQDWPAYNAAQTNEREDFEILLRDLCAGVPNSPYRGIGRPVLPLRDLVFAITMKAFTGLSARRGDTDVRAAHSKGLIRAAPHYNSVLGSLGRPELTPIFKSLIIHSAAPLRAIERDFAVDATGFATTVYSPYYDVRIKKGRKRQWIKAHAMVGVKTHIVTSVEVTTGNEHDSTQFGPLLRATGEHFQLGDITADKAYLTRGIVEQVEEAGGYPYIPMKENSRDSDEDDAWSRLYHLFHLNRTAFLAHYHQRSNVESVFSSMKRKFGGSLRSRTEQAQFNEVLAKVLCHNISAIVHASYKLGITPQYRTTTTSSSI